MRLLRIENEQRKLDNLFKDVSSLQEDEIKSHLSKYLCVQVSGYVEFVIKELVDEFHENTCKKETANFVTSKMKTFTNVDGKKISDFLDVFSKEWKESFDKKVTEEQISSLNSVISQRHLIAHGSAFKSNISFKSITEYYDDVKAIVTTIKSTIKK